MHPSPSTFIATLRALGADFSECWKSTIASGFPASGCFIAIHLAFDDPFKTVDAVMNILEVHDPNIGLEDMAWLPDGLEACGIHPFSVRLHAHADTHPRLAPRVRSWLDTSLWNRPDSYWREGIELPVHPDHSGDLIWVHKIHIPTTPHLALVIPDDVHLRHCMWGPTVPPLFARRFGIYAGSGLRSISFLGFPKDEIGIDIMLDSLNELEELPAGLRVPGSMRFTYCPKVRLPDRLQVDNLTLLGLEHLERALPRQLKVSKEFLIKDCNVSSLPGLRDSTTADEPGESEIPGWVVGNLSLDDLPDLREITSGILITGNLSIEECPRLGVLAVRPGETKNLCLTDLFSLHSLPSRLKVSVLSLSGLRNLIHLPEDLCVHCSIYIRSCQRLLSLPEGLRVSHGIHIEACQNFHLPEILHASSMGLFNLPSLKEVPHRIQVSELHMSRCPVAALPDAYTADESGRFAHSDTLGWALEELTLDELPDLREIRYRIGGTLTLRHLPELDAWPEGFEGRTIKLEDCPKLPRNPPYDGWSLREKSPDVWVAERET